jgi:hypothetical protein
MNFVKLMDFVKGQGSPMAIRTKDKGLESDYRDDCIITTSPSMI